MGCPPGKGRPRLKERQKAVCEPNQGHHLFPWTGPCRGRIVRRRVALVKRPARRDRRPVPRPERFDPRLRRPAATWLLLARSDAFRCALCGSESLTRGMTHMYRLPLMTVRASSCQPFMRMALLVVSIVILLGHNCALPGHSHASPIATVGDFDHGAAHEADGAYIGCCSATMAKSVPPPVAHAAETPAGAAETPAGALLPGPTPLSAAGRPVLAGGSRSPLYLLHTSFRI